MREADKDNPYPAMSERFRLHNEVQLLHYQMKLITEKCIELEEERDEARREICNMAAGKQGKSSNFSPDAIEFAESRGWKCFENIKEKK